MSMSLTETGSLSAFGDSLYSSLSLAFGRKLNPDAIMPADSESMGGRIVVGAIERYRTRNTKTSSFYTGILSGDISMDNMFDNLRDYAFSENSNGSRVLAKRN
ncbi:MAG: hypothetical protein ABIA21_00040 [Candidatus Aenigmatarchaeota archaeon]